MVMPTGEMLNRPALLRLLRWLVPIVLALIISRAGAVTLTGSFSPIAQGSNVDLTAVGTLDWVHWGLFNQTSVNRKATVAPQIGNFTALFNSSSSFASAYHYADNYNGYSWSDGTQTIAVTNTTTGMYVLGGAHGETNGFQIMVPADTALKTLQVFVGTFAAKGRFQASLSDSTTSYVDTSLDNLGNGPGGVYTINFA
ncbi:MAG TPA: hypothetical protein VH598_11355, partial [Verrucomicrobiae bacterium]|nr:hypothetical protein [Verrucomicrobiae bacterium]